MIIHNKYMKWSNELGEHICDGLYEFGKEHVSIYSLTNVPKYRSFQYRLMQRGIVTNIHLYKWGIKPSENCSLCSKEKETLTHLFFHCQVSQELWSRILEYLEDRYGQSQESG